MATILLSAVGASLGAGFGGTVLGLSGAVIGRAVGASVGRAIDQRVLGQGSRAVETGRIDRLRVQTAGEGAAIPRIWGQMRVPGHAIWTGPVTELRRQHGGGKGAGPRVTEIGYRLSFALALCEGPIRGIGRIWADGEEISPDDLEMRVYTGDEAQLPDPVIAAHEGEGAPAYRGIAYVVFEELSLDRWGNRVPQLSFEVLRLAQGGNGLAQQVQAVALIPATGEYALATRAVSYDLGQGERRVVNRNLPPGATDAWEGHAGRVAIGANGGWIFADPRAGSRAFVADRGVGAIHDGRAWVPGAVSLGAHGSGLIAMQDSAEVVLQPGAQVETALIIPPGALVLGVTARVSEAITGSLTSWRLGTAGAEDRFGQGLGLQAGSWARGILGTPMTYWQAEPVLVGATGGAFASGRVRLVAHWFELRIPD
ncbi:DUF2793 domain-containing protein [uncultured Paracoccus sp.]|uniref:DUF2793 domain-containing protein n=1 Tax=uncultured Paracoccus sp. TaxID=189685 RepID=UPI0025FF868E|nr:DUF2793 domain-containing protein [uncultured Paracoccus sp.]